MKETEAREKHESLTKYALEQYCPLTKAKCRKDCMCFQGGSVYKSKNDDTWDYCGVRCTCYMLVGSLQ